jgi:ribosomal protein S18
MEFRGIRQIPQYGIPHNSAEFWAILNSIRNIRNWKKYTEFRIGGIPKTPYFLLKILQNFITEECRIHVYSRDIASSSVWIV